MLKIKKQIILALTWVSVYIKFLPPITLVNQGIAVAEWNLG